MLSLPTAIWSHRLALKYQQSIEGWGSWLLDWVKDEAVEMAYRRHLSVDPLRRDSQEPAEGVALFLGRRRPLIILGAVLPLFIEPYFSNSRRWQVPPALASVSERCQARWLEIPQDRMS